MRKRKKNRAYLVYVLLILLSAIWFTDLPHANAEESIRASLSGEDNVQAGQAFTLTYGLKGVSEAVYAQDLTIRYDAEQLIFLGADSLKEHYSILGQSETPGQVRILTASHGADYAIMNDTELLTLRWSSKPSSHAATSQVSVTDTVVSNGDGLEISIAGAAHSIQIAASEPGDLNGDDKFTIGDLAIAAASYGRTSADSDWANVVKADVHTDGKIDILDLAIIARAILSATSETPNAPEWTAEKRIDVSGVTSSGLTLTWSGAADPRGVTEYKVYQDGSALGTVTGSVYQYATATWIFR